MMMHLVGEVILDKEKSVWRENNILGRVAFDRPRRNWKCPMKYCFRWLSTEKWKMKSVSIISIWVVVVWGV